MGDSLKRLAILGSTGSIGQQTLDIVRAFPDRLRVVGLAAGGNTDLLAAQINEFHPELAFIESAYGRETLSRNVPGFDSRFLSLDEIASHPDVDLVVVATSGKAGLKPTLAAIRAEKTVALANKEVLVMAGELVTAEAHRYGSQLLPIDSEHSALWQCLRGEERRVRRLILTASGGALRDLPLDELAVVTPEQALAHPTWQMGQKVTVDSATLMNKGFEAIEAHWLFDVPFDNIEVVLHRQSIVHSLVEFVDGSIKAQFSLPDMHVPIQYALSYPERWPATQLPKLDFPKLGALTFEPLDSQRFPCFGLAVGAGRGGGTYPTVLSAADEVAVGLFLERKIGFLDIAKLVESVLAKHLNIANPSLEDIFEADAWAREKAGKLGFNRC
jgi:1-deoxy-D-xylulose-5-phosphate reductoisomerase